MRLQTTFALSEDPKVRHIDEIGQYFGLSDEEIDALEIKLKAHFAQPGAKRTKFRTMFIIARA